MGRAKQDLEKCHFPCHIPAAYFSICDVCYNNKISKMTHTVLCTFSIKQKHATVPCHLKPIVFCYYSILYRSFILKVDILHC